jgi:LysM repeat protein
MCGITWQDLWNFSDNRARIANPDLIGVGQVIRTPVNLGSQPAPTPQPGACDYTVQPGDSLSVIAAARGLSWPDLWNFADNRARIPNPDLIYPGQVIRVPC